MIRNPTLLIGLMCLSALVYAQDLPEIEFGQIAVGDVSMTSFEADTSAEAYVLYDGVRHSIFDDGDSYKLTSYYHRRVKLLKPESFDRADIELSYRRREEDIRDVEAMIFLPSGERIKLRNRDIIRDNLSDERATVRFTFPQVTEGAVLEYRFRKISEGLSQIPMYIFQERIPVRMASYEAEMKSLFSYIAICNAFDQLCLRKEDQLRGSEEAAHAGGITAIRYKYVMCDLPAFDTEPYVNNFQDYLPHVYLQLDSYFNRATGWAKYLSTWETTARELRENPNIGMRFMRNGSGRRIANDIGPLMGQNEQEKAQYAMNAINRKMEWDRYYRFGVDESLNSLWDKGIASSGALNMMLYTVLKNNDIEVQPVLTGLRDYGRPIIEFPVLRQFQHLMVMATLDGEPYLLDVDGNASIAGLPRVGALNEAVWAFGEDEPYWVEVQSPVVTNVYQINGQIGEDGMADLSIKNQAKQYFALNASADLMDENDEIEGPVIDHLLAKFPETELIGREFEPWTDPTEPFVVDVEVKSPIGQPIDDYLYLQPILIDALQGELVEDDLRLFPIDFAYPFRQVYLATFDLPAGYVLDEMPEPIRVESPDRTVTVQMVMQHKEVEHQLAINFAVRVGTSLFPAEQYDMLREIFQHVIDIQESMVVLRKID
ncbi:MAG: DUF3857 domain-containing protein [Bacteroidota bacterium]